MNIFLVFVAVVILVLLLVFGKEMVESRIGKVFLGIGLTVALALPVIATVRSVHEDPVVGEVVVLGKSHVSSQSSRGYKSSHYTPECHWLTVDPMIENPDPDNASDWIRSVCIPESQWVTVEKGDTINLGFDKKRHKYWGNYIVGENEPLQSKNGKFRQYCYVDVIKGEERFICDAVSEAEYNRRSSEESIKDLKDPEYVKKLRESREAVD